MVTEDKRLAGVQYSSAPIIKKRTTEAARFMYLYKLIRSSEYMRNPDDGEVQCSSDRCGNHSGIRLHP